MIEFESETAAIVSGTSLFFGAAGLVMAWGSLQAYGVADFYGNVLTLMGFAMAFMAVAYTVRVSNL